jgi:hypothetical protein
MLMRTTSAVDKKSCGGGTAPALRCLGACALPSALLPTDQREKHDNIAGFVSGYLAIALLAALNSSAFSQTVLGGKKFPIMVTKPGVERVTEHRVSGWKSIPGPIRFVIWVLALPILISAFVWAMMFLGLIMVAS